MDYRREKGVTTLRISVYTQWITTERERDYYSRKFSVHSRLAPRERNYYYSRNLSIFNIQYYTVIETCFEVLKFSEHAKLGRY